MWGLDTSITSRLKHRRLTSHDSLFNQHSISWGDPTGGILLQAQNCMHIPNYRALLGRFVLVPVFELLGQGPSEGQRGMKMVPWV